MSNTKDSDRATGFFKIITKKSQILCNLIELNEG